MAKDLFQPKRRIEEMYLRALEQIAQYIQTHIVNVDDPLEIAGSINRLTTDLVFSRYCEAAAMKMVTHLFNDAGRTWRQAANKNSRGRTIYEAIKFELRGHIGGEVEYQVRRNAEMIRTLPLDISRNITQYIEGEAIKGRRASDIAFEIQERFPQNVKAKARLIARTEVSKTSTALTKARSEEIGVRWYVWRTSEDQRVRKSHDHMDGVLVSWRDPPSPEKLAGERPVGNYHAGCIFNCRCYPEPLLNVDDVKWPAKVYHNGAITRMTRKQFEQII